MTHPTVSDNRPETNSTTTNKRLCCCCPSHSRHLIHCILLIIGSPCECSLITCLRCPESHRFGGKSCRCEESARARLHADCVVGQIDLMDRVRVGITRDPPIIRLSSFLRSTDESSHLQNVTLEVGVSNKEGIISPFGLFPN